MKPLSSFFPAIGILTAIYGAYLWLQIPALTPYALQAFAGVTLSYLVLKRLQKAKLWHLLPNDNSIEISLLSFAFLLLIGATGNTDSVFYSLGYVHLFFLVLTTTLPTVFIALAGVLLFHFTLTQELTPVALSMIATLPLLLVLFLFGKKQYDEVQLDRRVIDQEKVQYDALKSSSDSLEVFLQQFLQPKLQMLEELTKDSTQLKTLQNQLSLLQSEVTKLLTRVKTRL